MSPSRITPHRIAAVLILSFCTQVNATTLFQSPTVNRTHVVFSYAGDLWTVPRTGGDAIRLTTGMGTEANPYFSPDGTLIAFTGQYDGNTDVFVIPATGGVPRRLTYHPASDEVAGWTPDGRRILFSSARTSFRGFPMLFTVATEGGLPEPLPLPMAERGSFSPDGSRLAYEPTAQWQADWKQYRGGQTDRIWIARLSDSSVEEIPRVNSNDRYPMWVEDQIFFLSDRDGAYTLYSFDLHSRQVERRVDAQGSDLKSASAWLGDGDDSPVIAYERFGTIHLYDVRRGTSSPVPIRLAADLPGLRTRLEKVGQLVFSAGISPSGARAVFGVRGEVVTFPAEKGDPRNLTRTPGVYERDPSWSPDGKWIAYFSDESGEYALHIRDQMGTGEVRKLPLPPTFYYSPVWSPDSTKIALNNKKLELLWLEVEPGTLTLVDRNPFGLRDDVMEPSWSPDGRWIAYIRQLENRLRAVFVHSLETGLSHQVTDGMSDARHAVFDRGGKYLYFTSSTNLGPAFSFAEMSTFPHQSSRNVYAVVLASDRPSPLAPESDEEKTEPAEEKADGAASKGAGKSKSSNDNGEPGAADKPAGSEQNEAAVQPTRIDLEGLDQRIVALPVPSRDYIGLTSGRADLVFILERPVAGPGQDSNESGAVLHKFDLSKRKLDKVMEGVTYFELSAKGDKALYRTGTQRRPEWFISEVNSLGGNSGPNAPKALAVADLEILVDPPAEWRQMYREVWRGQRDFFYDPNAHGLDLGATEKKYEPYLESVAHRSDLNYLFSEMMNQLVVGHMFIFGGDLPDPGFVGVGLLGCDYTVENGRFRFSRIFTGENWNPELNAPLTQPGVGVKTGEYLLAVNGEELVGTDNVFRLFQGKAGKQVRLRIGPNPDGSDARDVTVTPVASEAGLRNRDWVETNRRKVDELSGGRLAYVWVPDTSGDGYTSFNRYFFSQTHKQGAVIDERFNQGGSLADYIVEYLTRPLLNMIYFREGRDLPTPLGAIYGPKVMIINEMAGSGGDALPWYFRKMGVGPLIGKRTWGGLVASFRMPRLIDGGWVTAPDAAIYGLAGEWEVENVGVAPDIEVEWDPAAWRQGRDLQLERAVEEALRALESNPVTLPRRPAFPVYHP